MASLAQFAYDLVAHDDRVSGLPSVESLGLSSGPRQDMLAALQLSAISQWQAQRQQELQESIGGMA